MFRHVVEVHSVWPVVKIADSGKGGLRHSVMLMHSLQDPLALTKTWFCITEGECDQHLGKCLCCRCWFSDGRKSSRVWQEE